MERKLAAIVAADIVNYSILISQNEIATLAAFDRLQEEVFNPAINKYRGRVVRLMGDGSLLAFDSALDAVRFAVDVQRTMSKRKADAFPDGQIDFRMGANLGDIVHAKDDIHGEGINIAVRLEEIAPPGGICLSHSIYSQTKNAIGEDLLPIGERRLKNIAEPILVWRWHPPQSAGCVPSQAVSRHDARNRHGCQILDPKVTNLLADLHIRSARLALSDAWDEILSRKDEGQSLSLKEIHLALCDPLNQARELLSAISVDCGEAGIANSGKTVPCARTMSEVLAHALDGSDIFQALTMLKRIRAILRSKAGLGEKRAAFMSLTSDLLCETQIVKGRSSIRFAFVDV